MKKEQKDHVIKQCKRELKEYRINTDGLTFKVTADEVIYKTEMMTLNVLVNYKGETLFQFSEVYIDDNFNILQWHLYFN